ncbi:hypothetical protein L0B53_12220 [Vibrio sp. SS-MA-C1-2]|uniref:hypothetical protein n=1 Tax=Vibrio sp. SS-MA-C1-2 TaxID=2908646 RepID=UPI001F286D92|nr:hypothetical protein [Vibrio sp. SS-MA-C1-2]UJF17792.1 hypothetical protein L0B53_12220 [Vibrio sp. SS-MA-C1-2]
MAVNSIAIKPNIDGSLDEYKDDPNVEYDPVLNRYLFKFNWGQSHTLNLPNGNYDIYPSYTDNSIPNQAKVSILVSGEGGNNQTEVNIGYQEFTSDKAYFEYLNQQTCSNCHTGHFAPKFSDGPQAKLINEYAVNPNAIADIVADMQTLYGGRL